jgi:hypothetical protein
MIIPNLSLLLITNAFTDNVCSAYLKLSINGALMIKIKYAHRNFHNNILSSFKSKDKVFICLFLQFKKDA